MHRQPAMEPYARRHRASRHRAGGAREPRVADGADARARGRPPETVVEALQASRKLPPDAEARFRRPKDPVYRHRLLQIARRRGPGRARLSRCAYPAPLRQRASRRATRTCSATRSSSSWSGKVAIFAAFGMYQKWWRYVGLRDLETILKAAVVASLVMVGALFIWSPTDNDLPRSVAVMDLLLTVALIGGVRLAVRSVIERPPRGAVLPKGEEVLIVGAGEAGQLVARGDAAQPRARPDPDRLRRRRPAQARDAHPRPEGAGHDERARARARRRHARTR